MTIAGLNFLLGCACGLRLTLLPFVLVAILALSAGAIVLVAGESGFSSALADWLLAAIGLQAGYIGGVLARSFAS